MLTTVTESKRGWYYLLRSSTISKPVSSYESGFSYGPMIVQCRSTDLRELISNMKNTKEVYAIAYSKSYHLCDTIIDSNAMAVKLTVPPSDLATLRSAFATIARGQITKGTDMASPLVQTLIALMKIPNL